MKSEIHNSSLYHESLKAGNGSVIEAYCIIGKDVLIGDNVKIGPYCKIEDGTIIGDNTILQGEIKTGKNCTIGNNVTLKWGVILTSGVIIHDDVFMGARTVTLGSTADRVEKHGTEIMKGAYIGAGVYIAPRICIGSNAVVGAMAYVNKHICDGTFVGIPAKRIK